MGKRNIVVMGGSAGAVEALMRLSRNLPPRLPASLFVVVHFPEQHDTALPQILSHSGPLPGLLAEDGAAMETGRIYVAKPGYHLLLRDGTMELQRGPRENRARPSIDVLFRSAAVAYGPRTVAIIISGTLDDGRAGLEAVRKAGGLALVQDPQDALFPDLPMNALRMVDADSLTIPEIAIRLKNLVNEDMPAPSQAPDDLVKELAMVKEGDQEMGTVENLGDLSPYKCPDCGGPLWEIRNTAMLRFRCHLGHALSSESLALGTAENTERALWAAIELTLEQGRLFRSLAQRNRQGDDPKLAKQLESEAKHLEEHASAMKKLLQGLQR